MVNKEDHRLFQLLGISEVVLRAYFRSVLSVDKYHGLVGHVKCSNGTAHKVVRSRAVDDVKLLVVPFHMENCRENRVAIFLLNGEIVTHCVFCFNGATALDNASFIKH